MLKRRQRLYFIWAHSLRFSFRPDNRFSSPRFDDNARQLDPEGNHWRMVNSHYDCLLMSSPLFTLPPPQFCLLLYPFFYKEWRNPSTLTHKSSLMSNDTTLIRRQAYSNPTLWSRAPNYVVTSSFFFFVIEPNLPVVLPMTPGNLIPKATADDWSNRNMIAF